MFDASYTVVGDCHIWQRQTDEDGYGTMRLKGRKAVRAHRFSYDQANGALPANLMVCHTCDTPACVNPKHLFLGTSQTNAADRNAKGRQMQGRAHHKAKLTEADVRAIRGSTASGAEMARQYGVTKENIYAIRNGSIWKAA